MAVYHDAYIFEVNRFSESIQFFLHADPEADQEAMRVKLMTHALTAFDQSPFVRDLAGNVGGWQRDELVKIPEEKYFLLSEMGQWLLLLIYASLSKPETPSLSLGADDYRVWKDLKRYGWEDKEIKSVVRGNSTESFAHLILQSSHPVWQKVEPWSTAGSIGWLSVEAMRVHAERLAAVKMDQPEAQARIVRTQNILTYGIETNSTFCIIVSG
jgi:hypothetical protein